MKIYLQIALLAALFAVSGCVPKTNPAPVDAIWGGTDYYIESDIDPRDADQYMHNGNNYRVFVILSDRFRLIAGRSARPESYPEYDWAVDTVKEWKWGGPREWDKIWRDPRILVCLKKLLVAQIHEQAIALKEPAEQGLPGPISTSHGELKSASEYAENKEFHKAAAACGRWYKANVKKPPKPDEQLYVEMDRIFRPCARDGRAEWRKILMDAEIPLPLKEQLIAAIHTHVRNKLSWEINSGLVGPPMVAAE